MKKFNEKLGFVGWALLVAIIAMGAGVSSNVFKIGDESGSDVEIQMGAGRLKWDNGASKLQFSNDAGVSLKEIGSGGGAAAGTNILENGDFETGNPPSNWTASAGTFISATASPGFGSQSGSWDAAAGSNTLDSDFEAVPVGLENRHCNASIQYDYAAGSSGDYKFQVVGNTAGLIAETDLEVTTDWAPKALAFDCPASDSIKIRIISTVDAGVILLDNATLGRTDFFQLSQASIVTEAYYPTTTDCFWETASTTFADFAADTDCPAITVASNEPVAAVNTADNDLPDLDYSVLPAGKYLVTAHLPVSSSAAGSADLDIRISDGTTNGRSSATRINDAFNFNHVVASAVFNYSDAGARNFKLQGAVQSGGNLQVLNNVHNKGLRWVVQRFPSSAAEAITLETSGFVLGGYLQGTNDVDLTLASVGSFTVPSDSALTLTQTSGPSGAAEVACVGAVSTGSTCSGSDEQVGITVNFPRTGKYLGCFDFSHEIRTTSAGGLVDADFKVGMTADGSDTIEQNSTFTNKSSAEGESAAATLSAKSHANCAIYDVSTTRKSFKLFYIQTLAGSADRNNIYSSSANNHKIGFRFYALDNQFPTPAFTDLTNSLNTKVENAAGNSSENTIVFGAFITSAGSLSHENGDWVESVTNSSAGDYVIGTTNGLIQDYNCTCSTRSTDSTCIIENSGSGPVNTIGYLTYNSAGTLTNRDAHIICIGKRQ